MTEMFNSVWYQKRHDSLSIIQLAYQSTVFAKHENTAQENKSSTALNSTPRVCISPSIIHPLAHMRLHPTKVTFALLSRALNIDTAGYSGPLGSPENATP